MDAFVRRMSHEELAAQRERQSEEHDVFVRTVLSPHELIAQKRRNRLAERQCHHREKVNHEIMLGIRDRDGKLIRQNAIGNKVCNVHLCNEYGI